MTAATFPNLSFENPPGTGPTLLSMNAEPFTLVEFDNLELRFAGVEITVVFLATDFANIAQASADEVAALLELRIADLGAANDAGAIRLTSKLTGEDVELEVVGGTANFKFGFPAGSVSGETYAGGPPDGWTVLEDVASVYEWAAWTDENTRPEEIFDTDGWAVFVVSTLMSIGLFDTLTIPASFEAFSSWSAYGFLTGFVGEQAMFGQGLDEDFNTQWGLPIYFAFQPVHLLDAEDNPEDFESAWGNGEVGNISNVATFANGTKSADDFESFQPVFYVLTIVSAAEGEWRLTINGNTVKHPATGGEFETDIASALRTAVEGTLVGVESSTIFNVISFWPTNPDSDLNIVLQAPSGGAYDLVLAANYPSLAEEWIGQDGNPDFD